MKPTNKVFKYGISVCEWDNEKGKSYSIEKSYKTKEGEYKTSTVYFDKDIINLRDALNELIETCNIEPYDPDKHKIDDSEAPF